MDEPIDRSDRFCVIGAGPAGLLAARALSHAGIPYDQLERNPRVGGIWDIENDWTPMYETARFISSKKVSHLPGFPMPDHYPDYPDHRQVLAYLESFAEAYDLGPRIRFQTTVERAEPEREGSWIVTLDDGERRRYRGLFVCSGNTWDPNLPDYPGELGAESFHSVRYRSPEVFRGKRVLVVGGGNSGVDIACDAAREARSARISLRRGYHVVPKHILGQPADVFAGRVSLPYWLERPFFELLLRAVVGDLRSYGLPEPDHPILASHPIVNTEVLDHLRAGRLEARPDVDRFDGDTVRYVDGRADEVDLVVFATGYRVTYPFLDRDLFRWISKYPDLYLSGFHRERDDVCCLGLHQTDGGAFAFFDTIADMMCNFIRDQDERPERAAELRALKRVDRPDLSGGVPYVSSARHATYVKRSEYRRYCARLMKRMGWARYGTSRPPRPSSTRVSPAARVARGATS
jgi:cation diffusion facilitator CzcD-associated flavoprotein CzcO